MDVTIIGFIIISSIFLIYLYLTKHFDYWKHRNVVSLKAYPFVGSYLDVLLYKQHTSLMLRDQYNQFPKEKVIGGFKGRCPELIIRDPDIIKTVLIKDFNYFVNRGFNNNPEKEPLTKHLFIARDELWRALRHNLTPTFTSGKMRRMFPLIAECGEVLQQYIQNLITTEQEEDVKELTLKYFIDVVGSCAFGIKMKSIDSVSTPFVKLGKQIFETSFKGAFIQGLNDLAPGIFYALNFKILRAEFENFFIDLFKRIMKNRENEPPRHDFIDLLKELKLKGTLKTGNTLNKAQNMVIQITDELLAAQSFVFFAAGFDTSSTTLSFCLHELAFNSNVQIKLFEEISTILEKHDGKITYESIQEMKYLEMVFNETLRKYPPGAWLIRKCSMKYTFSDLNLTIDKGIKIAIPIYAIHHDEKYFPEPDKFDPERFSEENVNKRHPAVFLPFGDGPRHCIGMRFARLQMAVGLVSILRLFSVEPSRKSTEKISNFARSGLLLKSVDGIWLKLCSRKK